MNLSDVMRRATADLEPESTDLFERGLRRGKTLRRRRTTVQSAGAVLATAVVAVSGGYLFQGDSDGSAPVAGTPALSTSAAATRTTPSTGTAPSGNTVTPEQTLETLKAVLPNNLRVSRPELQQDKRTGVIDVSVVIDDGRGASLLSVQIGSGMGPIPASRSCADRPTRCRVRSDGSALSTGGSRPDKVDPSGLLLRSVVVQRANATAIAIVNTNTSSSTASRPTRSQPVFTHAQLTRMADSKLWRYPPAPGK